MANIPNISNISSLSSSQLIGSAKDQLKGKIDPIKQTLLTRANQLKQELKNLIEVKINSEKEYGKKFLKVQEDYKSGAITEELKNQKYLLFQSQKEEELKLLNNEIQRLQNEISDLTKDPLKDIKAQKKKLNDHINKNIKQVDKGAIKANISRNVQVLKNTAKDKIAPIVINLLTNLAISIIKKNNKLQELVDKTNKIIDEADTLPKINQARVLRNNALSIINSQEAKITKLKNIIQTIQKIIEIFNIIVNILGPIILPIPTPSPAPDVITSPKETFRRKVYEPSLRLVNSLSVGLVVITSVLNNIIAYLEDLKSQLHNLGLLIDAKTVDSTIDAEQFLQDIQSSPNLNNYKGFKFAIREENNPQQSVRGYKRHYAVAIDTNNVEVLKSDLSFTLDPNDLIDTLKIIIDRENLIA